MSGTITPIPMTRPTTRTIGAASPMRIEGMTDDDKFRDRRIKILEKRVDNLERLLQKVYEQLQQQNSVPDR